MGYRKDKPKHCIIWYKWTVYGWKQTKSWILTECIWAPLWNPLVPGTLFSSEVLIAFSVSSITVDLFKASFSWFNSGCFCILQGNHLCPRMLPAACNSVVLQWIHWSLICGYLILSFYSCILLLCFFLSLSAPQEDHQCWRSCQWNAFGFVYF